MLSLKDLPNIESVLGRNIQSSWYNRRIIQEALYMRIRRLFKKEKKKKKRKVRRVRRKR